VSLTECLSQRLWSLHQGAVEQGLLSTGTATQPSQTQPSQVQAEGEDEVGSSSHDDLDGDEAGPSQVCFTTLATWLHTFSLSTGTRSVVQDLLKCCVTLA